MIILRLSGGLGNQLFQYAFARYLEIVNGRRVKLDISDFERDQQRSFLLGNFNANYELARETEARLFDIYSKNKLGRLVNAILPWSNRLLIKQRGSKFEKKFLKIPDSRYLWGSWQSEKYFLPIKDRLKEDLTLKDESRLRENDTAKKIMNSHSVSLHVRRGDYVKAKAHVYTECSPDYYTEAIKRIKEKVENPVFYLFSDDIDWVKHNLKLSDEHYFVSDSGFKDYEELRLMSYCRHHITANSSFSWWGAWLAENTEKIIFTPKNWFIDPKRQSDDLVPHDWIKI